MAEEELDFRSLRVPCWCPQCGLPMKGGMSTRSYYDFGVCSLCFIEFIETREQRWRDGWRPAPEELKAYLERLA